MENTKLQRNGKHKIQNDNEMKKEKILKKHYFGDRTVISIKYFFVILPKIPNRSPLSSSCVILRTYLIIKKIQRFWQMPPQSP